MDATPESLSYTDSLVVIMVPLLSNASIGTRLNSLYRALSKDGCVKKHLADQNTRPYIHISLWVLPQCPRNHELMTILGIVV